MATVTGPVTGTFALPKPAQQTALNLQGALLKEPLLNFGNPSHVTENSRAEASRIVSSSQENSQSFSASELALNSPATPSLKTRTFETNWGVLLGLFLTVLYFLGGIKYRQHRARQAALQRQRIELLERIWKMTHHC